MTEDIHRFWDLMLKATAIVITLIGIYMGYQQFISEWELSNRKAYLELRTKSYIEMMETVSKITYPDSEQERGMAANRFWQLYVGISATVEDSVVEERVNSFSECLKANEVVCEQMDLETRSLSLSNAVRKSLLHSWKFEAEIDK